MYRFHMVQASRTYLVSNKIGYLLELKVDNLKAGHAVHQPGAGLLAAFGKWGSKLVGACVGSDDPDRPCRVLSSAARPQTRSPKRKPLRRPSRLFALQDRRLGERICIAHLRRRRGFYARHTDAYRPVHAAGHGGCAGRLSCLACASSECGIGGVRAAGLVANHRDRDRDIGSCLHPQLYLATRPHITDRSRGHRRGAYRHKLCSRLQFVLELQRQRASDLLHPTYVDRIPDQG